MLAACSQGDDNMAEMLNSKAYDFHYRNLDSTQYYAQQVLTVPDASDITRAEAFNHLAFVQLARMNYLQARHLLDTIPLVTQDHIELLVADVQLMRLCQRCSENKQFYDHREHAEQHLHRIREDIETLTPHQKERFIYAESEYNIVLSTYYYYMGLEQEAADALAQLQTREWLTQDTAQYLAYLYNYGAGGSITDGTAEQIAQQEWELLTRCYQIAAKHQYPYWRANALQSLSEHLLNPAQRDTLLHHNRSSLQLLNTADTPDSLLAGQFATEALDFFAGYGDVYQMAGAYRTLARCYQQIGDYSNALTLLHDALDADTLIMQAPDLVASICEQLSIVSSALNDKAQSDHYRNQYLDLIGRTQQDKAQEALAEQLGSGDQQRTTIIIIISVLLLLSVFVTLFLIWRQRHRNAHESRLKTWRQPLSEWSTQQAAQHKAWQEEQEIAAEMLQSEELLLQTHQLKYMEQRAKLAIVNSITPLIDRILVEYQRGKGTLNDEQRNYINELTLKIEDYNKTLTQWIQMQQGTLNMHIESFPVQHLFDIVAHNKTSFTQKGIDLRIENTDLWAKGDPTLTLFMINTITDNARRFTPEGGHITLTTLLTGKMVEISISDNGTGMSNEVCANLFKLHAPLATPHGSESQHHGFGLLNCRGIIEKYRKMSPVFSGCEIGCSSTLGKGSRFHFRLPQGIRRTLTALLLLLSLTMQARQHQTHPQTAAQWADSVYYANIYAHYEDALNGAAKALSIINDTYRNALQNNLDTLLTEGTLSTIPPEVEWLHHNIDAPYDVILDIRNEAAIAALALHKWQTYYYHNRVYTLLYKELHADNMLVSNIKELQHNIGKKNVTIIFLLALLIGSLLTFYLHYIRPRRQQRQHMALVGNITQTLQGDSSYEDKLQRIRRIDTSTLPFNLKQLVTDITDTLNADIALQQQYDDSMTLISDQHRRVDFEKQRLHITNSVLDNCLSTLKHETMYFPTRIRQMLENDRMQANDAHEMTAYYHTLHALLAAQAQQQTETTPLPSPQKMMTMLADTLQSMQKGKAEWIIQTSSLPHYSLIICRIDCGAIADKPYANLFNFDEYDNQPLLLCRQIVRDIGESTNYRACGIKATAQEGRHTVIAITLPEKVVTAWRKTRNNT